MRKYEFLPYLCDFYKTTHSNQYNPDIKFIYSNFVPRMSRIKGIDKVVFFGLQAFVMDKIVNGINKNFFELSREEFEENMQAYRKHIENSLGETAKYVDFEKYVKLYELGHLPIKIIGLKEGMVVPIKTPLFEIYNTHPDFPWVTNFLESYISAEMWYPITVATFALEYRKVFHKYYGMTCDDWQEDYEEELTRYEEELSDNVPIINFNSYSRLYSGLSEFGTRGGQSMDSAIKASAAFLTCFNKSANVAVGPYIQEYYDANEKSALGMVSTEHSVMCSNFAIDGDEETFFNKLITQIYPTGNISVVVDSYDDWNFIANILPKFKDKILNREGCVGIRLDSGEIVSQIMDGVSALWEIFGGSINKKGFKELDPHVKIIYGDSVTINRAKKIYQGLVDRGFAINNVSLGAGSFSMLCYEDEEGKLFPFTRDTFGIAIKATHCVTSYEEIPIFKNPKSDNENFKKSYKGRVVVYRDFETGEIKTKDGYDSNLFNSNDNYAEVDGKVVVNLLSHVYFNHTNGSEHGECWVNDWEEIQQRLDKTLEPLQKYYYSNKETK